MNDEENSAGFPAWAQPVRIGEITLAHEIATYSECRHLHLSLDENGNIVRCTDCGATLSAFWALRHVHGQLVRAWDHIKRSREEVAASYRQRLTFIAAKRIEQAWRRRDTVPGCPHCGRGILVDDQFQRVNKQNELDIRQSEEAQRDMARQANKL